MGTLATSREKGMRERPGGSPDKCGEDTQCSGEITQSQTNSVLFRHTLDYQDKMIQLVTRSQETIRGLHDRIWDVVHHVMEKAGKSAVDGLEIALRLVDMLLPIPLHLTFNTAITNLPGFTPEALTYALPPSTVQDAMTAPGEGTLASAHSAEVQAVQSTGRMMATDTESVKPLTSQREGGKDPNIPRTSISLVVHTSSFACWHLPPPDTKHHIAHHTPLLDSGLHTIVLNGLTHGPGCTLQTPVRPL